MIKRKLGFLVSSLLLCVSFLGIVSTAQAQDPQQLWALIISGSTEATFSNDTQYMYHVLHDHYSFAGIRYLDANTSRPGVDALSTKTNVRSAITSWLDSHSTANDIVFIFFSSHGGGYHTTNGLEGGRVETVGSDEGSEQRESTFRISFYPLNTPVDVNGDGVNDRLCDVNSDRFIEVDFNDDGSYTAQVTLSDIDGDGQSDDLFADVGTNNRCDILINADTNGDRQVDNWTSDGQDTDNDGIIVGVDFNGDGDRNDWVGVDEFMQVQDDLYWDDELAIDLSTLSYAKLIFVRFGCFEGDRGCFSGGLIDDISAKNRIIMTSSNETTYSWMPTTGSYSFWSEAFIDALHGQKTHYDKTSNSVVHESPPIYVDADTSNDNHVSMWEAWQYAWDNDYARLNGLETPWLDDNFNGEPTYIDEDEDLDQTDGLFSMETYFGFDKLKTPDINEDGIVNILDMQIVAEAFGSEPGDPNWNEDADLDNDDYVGIKDMYFVSQAWQKCYSDPPGPVSMETVLFTYPILTVVRKGETFSVNVVLFNVENLHGWEFQLYWNNAVLKCTEAEICVPDIWGENVFEVGPSIENGFNTTHGRCSMAVVALYPAPSFNGSMVVATLTFEARAVGSTILDLQKTILANSEACAIPHIAIDGLVKVKKR